MAPQQISTGFVSCLRYCNDVAHRRPTKLCTMFGRLLCWLVHYIYIFGGSCPPDRILPVQSSLYVQVLRSPIPAALLHGTPAAGVSQTLRRRTRNGITELSQRAPPIFGRAAITLGIGPHSNLVQNLRILPTCHQALKQPLRSTTHSEEQHTEMTSSYTFTVVHIRFTHLQSE